MNAARPPALPEAAGRWVTMQEACRLLGVHEATLRRWTDDGRLPAFRTPGGHRRYLRADLLAFLAGGQATAVAPARQEHLIRRALTVTRRTLDRRLRDEPWRPRYAADRAARLRASGRKLLGLLIRYAARDRDDPADLAQGRAVMLRYGQEAAEVGLTVPETARAVLVFRQAILDAISQSLQQPPSGDPDGWRVLRRASAFFDTLLVAALEGYGQAPARGNLIS